MKVEHLLNPAPSQEEHKPSTPLFASLHPSSLTSLQAQLPSNRTCKQKLPKDAPIFRKGPTKGEVLFPPHEAGDDAELVKEHDRFQIFPRGEIAQHCHHIPYSSDKKTFLSKTGRDAFEVFQYTFKVPGDGREYVVMWDYNIGLVRITPFFKCCKYSKTTPAKALNINAGLRDISHSITGGALAAQGYWMPFACAKAVAATFCYNIRYALTPLFGKDFVGICTHPTDPLFANFKIDKTVIQTCTAETHRWLQRTDARLTPSSSREPSETPGTPNTGLMTPWRRLKPRVIGSATPPESGSGTDSGWGNCTPIMSPITTWVPVNKPRTEAPQSCPAEVRAAEGLLMLSSPKGKPDFAIELPSSELDTATSEKKESTKRAHVELEDDIDGTGSSSSDSKKQSQNRNRKEPHQSDSRVALMLLQLRGRGWTTNTTYKGEHREKRARRSSVPHQIP